MLLDEPKYVDARFNLIEPRSRLMQGDLLMNIVGASIGRVAMYDRNDVANINQAVCLIRLRDCARGSTIPAAVLEQCDLPWIHV
jgi:type I restriction enzyme S subunit